MEYILRLTDDASDDIWENYEWYEEQREELGEEFLESLNHTLKRIEKNPLLYQLQYKDQRAALLNRFPYRVFYFIDQEMVVVQAVVRTSRDPKIWQERK